MSLSKEARFFHDEYERANSPVRQAVDSAADAAIQAIRGRGFDVSMSDPAEELVAAIYKYVIDSAEAN
jgi:hypothetical protein